MGFLSHRVEKSELKAGDHIYTWRTAFTYSHHGIYVGANKVVHFTQDHRHLSSSNSSASCFSSSSSVPYTQSPCSTGILDCGFRKDESGVIMSCLNCFLGDGSLCRFEYGITGPAFIAKCRGGTCTMAKSDPPEDVVHRAMYLLHNGFGNYDVFRNNCEDFALYCKTGSLVCSKKGEGLGGSGQATSVFCAPLAAVITMPLRLFVTNPAVMVAAGAMTYSFNRYATDVGVRGDMVRVRVEDMELFLKDEVGDGDENVRSEKRQKRS